MGTIVFFDLNNTLLNDMYAWHAAVRAIFNAYGIRPPTIAEHFQTLHQVGSNLKVYEAYGIKGTIDDLNAIYDPAYEQYATRVALFPNVAEILQYLSIAETAIGLITAQKRKLAMPLLKKFGIDAYFNYMDFNVHDKTVSIRNILRTTSIDPHKCYFVGDAPSDIRDANNASVRTIAFLNGHIPEHLVMAAQPDYCIRDLSAIATII
jgi:phosphoglycolate phosphatase